MAVATALAQDAVHQRIAQAEALRRGAVELIEQLAADAGDGSAERGRGEVGSVVEAVVGDVGVDGPAYLLRVAYECHPRTEAQVFVAAAVETVVVGIARGQEVLARGSGLAVGGGVDDGGVAVQLPPFLAVADAEVHVGALGAPQVVGLSALPVVALAGAPVVVEVVGIGNDGEAREIGVAHGEEAGQIAHSRRSVAYP